MSNAQQITRLRLQAFSSDLTRRSLLTGATAAMLLGPTAAYADPMEETYWLDRLQTPGRSELDTAWQPVTDRVMGGRSDITATVETLADSLCYRMRGTVSTANNGGFVQLALPLTTQRGAPLNASDRTGIRLRALGNGETYAIHLRTSQNRAPWDYFTAEFTPGAEWEWIDLPFTSFVSSRGSRTLDSAALVRLAVVGIGRDFSADLAVSALGLVAS